MQTIVSVQALRAVAAIAVALCHFDQVRLVLLHRPDDPIPLAFLSSGVDLFFVISGFIMVCASRDLFAAPRGAAVFLRRRIARIVPLYWLATATLLPLFGRYIDWSALFCSLLFIPYRGASGNVTPLLGVGWTLNFEMYFYLLFAALIFLPRKIAVPTLGSVLAGIAALGAGSRPPSAILLTWTDPIILEFAIGMGLAQLYLAGVRIPGALRIGLAIAGAIATASVQPPFQPPTSLRVLQWGIPAAAIFAAAVLGTPVEFGPLRSPLVALGDASYALYLVHTLVAEVLVRGWRHGFDRFPMWLVLGVGFAAAIAAAFLSEHAERWLRLRARQPPRRLRVEEYLARHLCGHLRQGEMTPAIPGPSGR